MRHQFGGDWTKKKLDVVAKYLRQWLRIFTGKSGAQHFIRIYVDAFAGTGDVATNEHPDDSYLPFDDDAGTEAMIKGSARIALEFDPGFHEYVFIEKNKKYATQLAALEAEFPERWDDVHIETEDANIALRRFIDSTDWRTHRAVVFLDPYGMQVDWETVEELGRTNAVDLWLLFPLSAINRMLTKKERPPTEWETKLTKVLGTDGWKSEFYRETTVETLFGQEAWSLKDADFEKIGQFFLNRLKSAFFDVAPNPLILKNSQNTPMFLLCFAAANEKGSVPAIRIARHLLQG